MVGIVTGGSVEHLSIFFNCEVVRNWNWLIMGHQETHLRTHSWAPALHLGAHSWFGQVNGTLATLFMVFSSIRHPLLVSTPTQFSCLVKAFGDKSVNWPSIPECLGRSSFFWPLGISLCNMNSLNAQIFHEESPLFSCLRLFRYWVFHVFGKV